MTKIVVGIDESVASLDAARWAVAEGARCGADVTAILAWSYLDQYGNDGEGFRADYTAADAQAAVERLLAEQLPGAAITGVAVNDLPARALIEAAAESDLLVVGAHGKGVIQGALLGSVSRQCLHHSPVPVAVVRGPAADGPVVVGVDGSEGSLRALHWALDAARRHKATLKVVHAARSDDVLTQMLGEVDTDGITTIDAVRADGPAARALLDASTGAAMVVVGSRGRGGFARLLLGSVSQHVLEHATCPVVVVPPADRA